jgi:hypothetical protein
LSHALADLTKSTFAPGDVRGGGCRHFTVTDKPNAKLPEGTSVFAAAVKPDHRAQPAARGTLVAAALLRLRSLSNQSQREGTLPALLTRS